MAGMGLLLEALSGMSKLLTAQALEINKSGIESQLHHLLVCGLELPGSSTSVSYSENHG